MRISTTRRLSLWWRRNPILAPMLLLLAVVTVGAVGTIGWLYRTAEASRIEAAIALDRDRERQAWMDKQREDVITRMIKLIRRLDNDTSRRDHDLLATVDLVEWVAGSATLLTGEERTFIREERVGIVRGIIEQFERQGHADAAEAMFWRLALAHWLTDTGRFEEAGRVLDRAQQQADAILAPDDPMRERVGVMRAVLDLTRHEREEGFRLSDGEYDSAMTTISEGEDVLYGPWSESPLHDRVRELIDEEPDDGRTETPDQDGEQAP